MEATPYEIIGAPSTASTAELRRAYKRAALRLHPDRAHMPRSDGDELASGASVSATFRELQASWALVGTEEERAAYDHEHAERVEARKRRVAFNIEIDLDDMDFIEAESGGVGLFSHACRCGSTFDVTESELDKGVDLLQCEGCSQIARVMYELNPEA